MSWMHFRSVLKMAQRLLVTEKKITLTHSLSLLFGDPDQEDRAMAEQLENRNSARLDSNPAEQPPS